MHYTLQELNQKTLKELKEIGYQLNVLPEGDRRYARNWVKALVGKQPPLLQLLEVSPAVEVEPVAEAIEVQAQEPIESKFGRIVYPRPTVKLIAQNDKPAPQFDRADSVDVHNRCSHSSESVPDSDGAETEALGSGKSYQIFAVVGNHHAAQGGVLPQQPSELAAIYNDEQPPNRGDGKSRIEPKLSQSAIGFCVSPVTFSPRFLATYPPYFGEVHYKADSDGQLNLLESVETDDEPPDPDDFQTLAEFRQAIALWDEQHPEPIEISLDSMCEWAPCPHEWYEPETAESSSTCNFSIPTFDAWCDRANRQTDSDEPPDTGIFAKLPGPKPPKFPPRAIGQVSLSQGKSGQLQNNSKSTVVQNHINISPVPVESNIRTKHPETIPILFHSIAAGSNSRLGRDPPGGDAM